jgi:Contractile injection system tube protein/LysM domain
MAAIGASANGSAPGGFTKAYLQIDGGDRIDCYFNPTEYSISKSNEWTYEKVTGTSLPPAQFSGGNPRQMELSLLLDQTLFTGRMTVQAATDALFKMMEVPAGASGGGTTAVPPFITFQWGAVVGFKAVCTSLTVAYKLFKPTGEPIRAEVKMTLKQAETASTRSSHGANRGQNPTTRANAGFGVHTVRDGDTLPSIAYQAYGDATRWRVIAEANGVDNPMHLRRGTSLSLPRLES